MRPFVRLAVVPSVLALGLLVGPGIGVAAGVDPAPDAAAAAAAVGSYASVDLPGVSYTEVAGINNWGVLVGNYGNSAGRHGFIKIGGQVTTVDVPGATDLSLTAVNDLGTVTGTYWDAARTTQHSFLRYAWGAIRPLDVPGLSAGDARGTVATGINDLGTVVGSFFTTTYPGSTPGAYEDSAVRGFVWRNGQFTVYDAPASEPSGAAEPGTTRLRGLNNAGVMVGDAGYRTPGVPFHQGFVVSGASFTTFVDPTVPTNACGHTEPASVNDWGTVVGTSGNGCTNPSHPVPTYNAWLLDGDQFTFLAYPGAARTVVSGINDWGTAVGTWTDDAGQQHGFVLRTR